jgi:hypothetical protein
VCFPAGPLTSTGPPPLGMTSDPDHLLSCLRTHALAALSLSSDPNSTQDVEWKTDRDARETLLKDEDGKMIVGQDNAEGGLYDNEDEYREDTFYNKTACFLLYHYSSAFRLVVELFNVMHTL